MLRTLLATLRPPFLLLALACVALGLALALPWGDGAGRVPWVLAGAVAAHAAVNVLNEWHDARSGLDALTQRTPFSGGSGALPALPQAVPAALALGLGLLALTAACGLALLGELPPAGWRALLPIGVAGLVLVLAYTPWLTHHPLACLFAPGLGFGPLMVLGTQAAVAARLDVAALVASLVPCLLASGLLLLNQFPDVEADRAVGRRTLPMVWGRPAAARVYTVLVLGAQGVLLAAVVTRLLPAAAALGLLTAPLAWQVAAGARRHADDREGLLPMMGRNVALTLAMPTLVALGLALASPWQAGA